jgi:hypothetical protein
MFREAKLTLQNQKCIKQMDGKCLSKNELIIYIKLSLEANLN